MCIYSENIKNEQNRLAIKQFVATALWADLSEETENEYTIYNIDHLSLKVVIALWDKFVSLVDPDILQESIDEQSEVDSLGHDLYLTLAGHGAGFWDGDYKYGDYLTNICDSMGIAEMLLIEDNSTFNIDYSEYVTSQEG